MIESLRGLRIGCAMTGSFCTFRKVFEVWRALKAAGAEPVQTVWGVGYKWIA